MESRVGLIFQMKIDNSEPADEYQKKISINI